MKKTQVALAALALVASTAAMAEVQISGRIEAGWQSVSGTTGPTSSGFSSYNLQNSELRVTGSEDLGGGMKANFYLASGFETNNGSQGPGGEGAALFNRGATVGISGDFGSISLGRWFAPTTLLFATGDPNASNSNSVLHMVSSGMSANFWNDRAINYSSPTIGGFNLLLQYADANPEATATAAAATGKNQGYGISYTGLENATFSWAQHRNGCNATSGNCWTSSVGGANYTVGAWKVGIGFTNTSAGTGAFTNYDQGYDQANGSVFNGSHAAGAKSSGTFGGVAYNLTEATTLGLSYYTNKRAAEADSADLTALSVRHSLSKRTLLFAQYNSAGKTTSAAAYASNYNGIGADANKAATAFFAGVVHQF